MLGAAADPVDGDADADMVFDQLRSACAARSVGIGAESLGIGTDVRGAALGCCAGSCAVGVVMTGVVIGGVAAGVGVVVCVVMGALAAVSAVDCAYARPTAPITARAVAVGIRMFLAFMLMLRGHSG
jgi:hypothetical protein